jgi:thioredoxin-dependent peroxiredoxin
MATEPIAGDAAPEFEGVDQNGKAISLASFKGKKVALYFYPKDDTPGCTKEACNLRDNEAQLKNAGYTIVGVSVDDEKSHKKFATKYGLNFSLLPDPDHAIVDAYGVWVEKSMYGKKYMGTARVTFLIGADGRIERVIDKVKPEEHAAQILAG